MKRILLAALMLLAPASVAPATVSPKLKVIAPLSSEIDTTHVDKMFSALPALYEYKQPAIYEQWWQDIAKCERIRLPELHKAVRFFVVNTTDSFAAVGDTTSLLGAYKDGEIVLSMNTMLKKSVVQHEMGHYLLDMEGLDFGPFHIAEFYDNCGLHPWGG